MVGLFHYPVALALKTGEVITGKALDTKRNASREECIEIEQDHKAVLVVLDSIAKLNILVDNPYFDEVVFE
ncbi:Rho-binding antiterminator [Marinomonas sp. TW1]|uniref:Rho-binding antiterminator n=1 Tax=Marinomonas sp. TW1 TaxID=1561203 RepID=UPI0022B241EE|nr:Rho-binding antiterminator [Marinomonas sp. TW1]